MRKPIFLHENKVFSKRKQDQCQRGKKIFSRNLSLFKVGAAYVPIKRHPGTILLLRAFSRKYLITRITYKQIRQEHLMARRRHTHWSHHPIQHNRGWYF